MLPSFTNARSFRRLFNCCGGAILILLALGPCLAHAQTQFNASEARKSVVYIKRITPGLAPAVGSGFLVSKDGLIFTNRHVVQSSDENIKGTVILVGVPTVKDPDTLNYFRAQIVHIPDAKDNLDFAVLRIAARKGEPEFKPLALSFDKLELGSDVAVLGYPHVQDNQPNLSFNKGSISASRVRLDDRSYYQTDAAVNPGNSGGPLLNVKGEAVGIVTFKKGDASNIGFAVYLSEVRAASEQARKLADRVRPEPGPLDPNNLPVPASISPKKDSWQSAAGTTMREAKGALVVDRNGAPYWIVSKESLPENFQLVLHARIEFLQGGQALQPSQRSILRTLCIRFATSDVTTSILERKGNLIQFSHELLLFHKEGAGDAVAVAQKGNSDEPFTMVVTKKGSDYTISVGDEVLLKYSDPKPLKSTQKFCIGGYLSRLYLGDVSVINLDDPTPTFTANQPMSIGGDVYTPGLDQTMLLLQGDVLVRLGPDGVTEIERRQLGARYTHIAERRNYFVALSETKSVVLLDRNSLKPIRQLQLPYRKLTDLALNPNMPVAYIAVEFDITAPSFRVIIFDEDSGEAHEPPNFYGTWVRVHPAGTFLLTGHRDIYERGSKFFVNPDWRIHTVPDYGMIDLLISYALDDRGQPTFVDLKTKAGGNGSGIRMSADGERVTYLSHVGTPEFSGNLGGFDPLDLQKLPVAYATKDRASTHDLAFHPYLPLCASPSKDSVVFFHREKGTVEERLSTPAHFDRVHRVFFAPDGKHVVLDCELGGARAMRSLPIKLSPDELATVAKPVDPGSVDNSAKVKAAMIRAHREIEKKVDPVKVAREKAIDWIKLNNVFGPDHQIVADQTAAIDQELDAGRNMHLVIGEGLVKSGTPSVICIHSSTFFAFSLTEKQAENFDFPKMTIVKHPGNRAGWRLAEPKAQLHDLKIASADSLDGTQKITGTVQYRRLDAESAHYALQIQYVIDDQPITAYHHLGEYLTKTEGEIQFSFAPMVKDKSRSKGVQPVFVELVNFATAARDSDPAIASNTTGQLVILKQVP